MKLKGILFLICTIAIFPITNIFALKTVSRIISCSIRPIITWSPIDDATSYEVKVKQLDASGNIGATILSTTTTATNTTLTSNLTAGTIYRVTVKTNGVSTDKLDFYIKAEEKYIIRF